uniref:LysR family transcriptional regulator n=1 Tax=Ningiella ruwaisensis TaxID=2364274 RepID=UPI0010A04369|nr:LysR family transcriptional regulator [Ningiella ruwaisensis]
MREIHLDDLRLFSLVAKFESISAANRETGIAKANLSRMIERLEAHSGTPLFDRFPKGIKLTHAGLQLLPVAQMAERVGRDAQQTMQQVTEYPSGRLRVAASTQITRHLIAPAMSAFLKRWPEVTPELIINHMEMDPIAEDCDIFIRIGRPSQPYLVARRLLTFEMKLWGSDIAHHNIDINDVKVIRQLPRVVTDSVMIPRDWVLKHDESSAQITIDSSPNVLVGEPGAAYEMVKAGYGMTLLPRFVATSPESQPLKRLLPQWRGTQLNFFAVMAPHRTTVPAVRAFLDFLLERLEEK